MKKQKGFTLTEMMIVVTIIGILATLIVGSYAKYTQRARDVKRKAHLEQIRTALELYRTENFQYPPLNWDGWCTQISNSSFPQVKNALEAGYISQVPRDPRYSGTYQDYFYRRISGNRYALYAELEIEDVVNDDFSGCARIGNQNNEYDYKITNP